MQDLSLPVGNCMQAAIASLLELPIESVPHFCEGLDEATGYRAWLRMTEWFERRGLHAKTVLLDPATQQPAWAFPHLAFGKSPRGVGHMVVRCGFDVVHDPHPEGGRVDLEGIVELHLMDARAFRLWDDGWRVA